MLMNGTDDAQVFTDSGYGAVGKGIIGTSCGYFDGVAGTYVSVPDHADWNFGTGNFTIETWVRLTTLNTGSLWSQYVAAGTQINLYLTGGTLAFYVPGTCFYYQNAVPITLNTWTHIAVVRSGTNLYLFIDGVSISWTASTAKSTKSKPEIAAPERIGHDTANATYLSGYLEELRISNTARYTTAFTPPTTAFTSDANTKLLLHFDGGEGSVAFTDSGNTGHTVTANGNAIQVIGHGANAVGNVKTENSAYKFSPTSAYFDGTGDAIELADSEDWAFGSDPFTIDCWIKRDAIGTRHTICAIDDTLSGGTTSFHFSILDTNTLFFYVPGTNIQSSGTINTDWHHVAVVVESDGSGKLYIDGVNDGSNTGISVTPQTAPLCVGKYSDYNSPTLLFLFTGYIDELRISKGIARTADPNDYMYLNGGATFTPPTAPYIIEGENYRDYSSLATWEAATDNDLQLAL